MEDRSPNLRVSLHSVSKRVYQIARVDSFFLLSLLQRSSELRVSQVEGQFKEHPQTGGVFDCGTRDVSSRHDARSKEDFRALLG